MNNGDGFDRMVDALGHKYRRRLLVALLDHNPQDDTDPQDAEEALGAVDEEEEHLVETELIHSHLPKLEELNYISWDQETGQISKGPDWGEIEPLLRLLRDHEEELPDHWL